MGAINPKLKAIIKNTVKEIEVYLVSGNGAVHKGKYCDYNNSNNVYTKE